MLRRNHESLDIRIGELTTLVPLISSCHSPKVTDEQVNMLQGRVDLKFRITGSGGMFQGLHFQSLGTADRSGAGTVYFTSIRPQQESTWRIGQSPVQL